MLIIVDQLFEVVAGETSSVLNPGDIVYLPAGVRHALTVLGDAAGQALSIHLSRAGQ